MTTAPPGGLAVATRGLTKRFGSRTVVDHVDIAIPAGSVCGFVGPNGAGKTTTIRMLLGLIRPPGAPGGGGAPRHAGRRRRCLLGGGPEPPGLGRGDHPRASARAAPPTGGGL